jgi:hypothetical protein
MSDHRCPDIDTVPRTRVVLALALVGVLALLLTAVVWLATAAPIASAKPSDQPCARIPTQAIQKSKQLQDRCQPAQPPGPTYLQYELIFTGTVPAGTNGPIGVLSCNGDQFVNIPYVSTTDVDLTFTAIDDTQQTISAKSTADRTGWYEVRITCLDTIG